MNKNTKQQERDLRPLNNYHAKADQDQFMMTSRIPLKETAAHCEEQMDDD